jgi:hypothetical protein
MMKKRYFNMIQAIKSDITANLTKGRHGFVMLQILTPSNQAVWYCHAFCAVWQVAS